MTDASYNVHDLPLQESILHCFRVAFTYFTCTYFKMAAGTKSFCAFISHLRLKEERVTLFSLQSLLGPLHNHLSMTIKDCSMGAAVSKVGVQDNLQGCRKENIITSVALVCNLVIN